MTPAKFLEVGVKSHYIPHKTRNGKMTTSYVKGITGTHALSKVINSRRSDLSLKIQNAISELITK